jgi:hypothetical protein
MRATETGANAMVRSQITMLAWRKGDSPCRFGNTRTTSLKQSANVSFSIGCCEGASRREAKLLEAAQRSWRRLDGHNQLPKLVLGVTFNDGIEVIAKPTGRQPITAAA